MTLYYLLLVFTRFHSDPRVGMSLFHAGFVEVTPIKVLGLFTVLAALTVQRPAEAAPRLRNSLGMIFSAFVVFQILELLVFRPPTPSNSISSLVSLSLLLLATRALVNTEDRMRKAVRVMILAYAFGSLWLYKQHFVQHIARVDGLEQDANYEALMLVTAIPLAVWMALYETGSWWRRIGLVCAGLMAGGVLLTQSRAGLIAAVVTGVAAVAVSKRKMLASALLVMTLALGIVVAPAGMTDRFQSIKFEGAASNGDEDSSRTHLELWQAGLAMIASNPLTGVGLEQFKEVAPYYNRELLQVAHRRYIAHNTYIQIAAETGLPVLFLFLALSLTAIMRCREVVVRGTNPSLARMASAIQLGLIGYSVAAASVTAEYLTTFWTLVFFSQNLREIVFAVPVRNLRRSKTLAEPAKQSRAA